MLTELNGKLMDGNPKQNIDPIKVNEGNHQENPYQLDTVNFSIISTFNQIPSYVLVKEFLVFGFYYTIRFAF